MSLQACFSDMIVSRMVTPSHCTVSRTSGAILRYSDGVYQRMAGSRIEELFGKKYCGAVQIHPDPLGKLKRWG